MRTLGKQLGKFKDRITLQYQSRTSDNAGGWTNTWVDDLTVWCMKRPLSASQALQNDKIEGEQQFVFTIRYTDDFVYTLSNDYRVKQGSDLYNIHTVTILEDEDYFVELVGWKI